MIIKKSRGMLQLVSRDIRNVFSHNYRKLNDRQSRYFNGRVVKIQLASTRQNFKVCNMPKYISGEMLQSVARNSYDPEIQGNVKKAQV